jgi:methylmalonyl-CoA mutase C-terminal domain/subunit
MGPGREKIRVLLAQFPLETHSRGVFTVANMLRDSGMEVIYIGNSLPEQIVDSAIQENVDVVGISTLTGGELTLGNRVLELASKKGVKDDTVFVMGGIFPPEDEPKLKKIGFDALFTPGATKEEIANCIKETVATKAGSKN